MKATDKKIVRLTTALETGGTLAPLIAQLQTRQTEREALIAAIAAADATGQDRAEPAGHRAARARADRVVAVVAGVHVDHGRPDTAAGSAREPLRLTPDGESYRFEGDVMTGELIAGAVGVATKRASLMPASWNQIAGWLQQIDDLRRAA